MADRTRFDRLASEVVTAKDDAGLMIAIRKLGQLGDERAVRVIRPFLKHTSVYVRAAAASSLVDLGDNSARLHYLLNNLEILEVKNPLVRMQSCFNLADLGDARALQALSALLEKEKNTYVRKTANYAIDTIKAAQPKTKSVVMDIGWKEHKPKATKHAQKHPVR